MKTLQGQQLNNQAQQQSITMNEQSLAADKSAKGLQFAANVAYQIHQEKDPIKKKEIYATGMYVARKNNYNLEGLPEQYDERAQQILDVAHMQYYNPDQFKARIREVLPQTDIGKLMRDRDLIAQRGGDTSIFDELIAEYQSTSQANKQTPSQKDWDYYNKLKNEDPEAASAFGRKVGFVSEEGTELSVHLQKQLSESTNQAVKSANNARKFKTLATEFENVDVGGGLFGSSWAEKAKEVWGSQDAVSELNGTYLS